MHKPNISRQRQPVPAHVGKQPVRIQSQNLFGGENQTQNGLRPHKSKKHKRR